MKPLYTQGAIRWSLRRQPRADGPVVRRPRASGDPGSWLDRVTRNLGSPRPRPLRARHLDRRFPAGALIDSSLPAQASRRCTRSGSNLRPVERVDDQSAHIVPSGLWREESDVGGTGGLGRHAARCCRARSANAGRIDPTRYPSDDPPDRGRRNGCRARRLGDLARVRRGLGRQPDSARVAVRDAAVLGRPRITDAWVGRGRAATPAGRPSLRKRPPRSLDVRWSGSTPKPRSLPSCSP